MSDMEITHKHFSSPRSLADWLESEIKGFAQDNRGYTYLERYRDSITEGIELLRRGDTSIVPRAEKISRELMLQIPRPVRVWDMAVAGAFPSVPAYLAGEPENMYHQSEEITDKSPIRLWINLTASVTIKAEGLVNRGAALSAVAMAMSDMRPVIISPFVQLTDFSRMALVSWDLCASPLVLSELASISLPSVTRYAGVASCYAVVPQLQSGHFISRGEEAKRIIWDGLGCKQGDFLRMPSHNGWLLDIGKYVEWVKREFKDAEFNWEDR